jgi:phenylalanine-4-hydroxylase
MRLVSAPLPAHLQRYVVDQDYASYTPRDQSVWRHILKRLRGHLESRAHPIYLRGLEATGIDLESIPRIETMNEKLGRLGWRCVGVRGFIPPAIFTELQSLGVLAIAADIRSHDHIGYTPAPDIVHESAGHAPIIADDAYAAYLKSCGEVGFKAIASAEDSAMFEAIRNLSVVKEDPSASPDDVAHAQARLEATSKAVRYVSESTKASRLYWWTAEYGLVGDLAKPYVYGAGLLSSIAEAEYCLTTAVRKIPHSLECVNRSYDITKMQPELFVARDFKHLNEVLSEFRKSLAFVCGGDYGLDEALRSRTVNHIVAKEKGGASIELTGEVVDLVRAASATGPGLTASVIELLGPTMISAAGRCTEQPKRINTVIVIGSETLPARGRFSFRFPSGFVVGGHEVVDLRVWMNGRPIHVPTWAYFAVAESVPSVVGGPADTAKWDGYFGSLDSFTAGSDEVIARKRKADALQPPLAKLYSEVRAIRESKKPDRFRLSQIIEESRAFGDETLLREEVDELLQHN